MSETDKPTLLVIDDEPEILQSLRGLLRREFNLHVAQGAEEALAILAAHPIQVILTDQRMPGMTGVEVLHRARQIRPETTRLLVTAHADIRAVVGAINEGQIFRYVAKPWEPDDLQIVVRQAVDHHNLIGAFAHIAPGVTLGGNVTIGARALIGLGASVMPGRSVGANAIIGAGAVVVDDIPDGVVAVGVPARIQRSR